jgi:putative ABC transport system ATP-binding protein
MSEYILRTEKLTKVYNMGKRKIPALSGVDLQVSKGEFTAIMGPSGSGKTTLLNVLGCLDTPTSGKMVLDKVDVAKLPEKELYKIRRNKIGFVFQTFNLLPYMNTVENVELPMECTKKSKSERRNKAYELLKLVGLEERKEHRPQRLSAGEQQRVAIARALANDPAIILADEPTGNLDAKNKHEIVRLLANLNIDRGTTVIMVTHDSQVASHTERVLFLKDGRITKEKQGLHLTRKKLMCPYCGSRIQPNDDKCPNCRKRLENQERIDHDKND